MVKLDEVEDHEYEHEEIVSDDSESGSEFSGDDDDDFDEDDETVLERIAALKDIVPLRHRHRLSTGFSALTSWGKSGVSLVGKTAWVLTTSMLLLVLPLALEIEKEQALVAYEKEAMQQQGTQQMLGGANPYGQPQPQEQPQQGKAITPPGF